MSFTLSNVEGKVVAVVEEEEEITRNNNWLGNSLTSNISGFSLVIGTSQPSFLLSDIEDTLNDGLEVSNTSNTEVLQELITPEDYTSTRGLNYNSSCTMPSPRSLSESSHTMKDVLLSHPTFNVFRKSNSLDALTDPSPEDETKYACYRPEEMKLVGSGSPPSTNLINIDEPSREEILLEAERSFPSLIAEKEVDTEWHLSSGEEMASLHWGEESTSSSEHAPLHNIPETSNHLVNEFHSPPNHRASTARTPLHPLVHFSPLSLAPSPLLGIPLPTPHDDDDVASPSVRIDFQSQHYKAILKKAGTPGTGRSVRFSASTTREPTPFSMVRFADAGVEIEEEEEDFPISINDYVVEETRAVASFLSKLQAAIPSPENSFTESIYASPGPFSLQPRVTISSPTSPTPLPEVPAISSSIFDTSIPHSFLGASVAENLTTSRFDSSVRPQEEVSTFKLSSPPISPPNSTISFPSLLPTTNIPKPSKIDEALEDLSQIQVGNSASIPRLNSSFYQQSISVEDELDDLDCSTSSEDSVVASLTCENIPMLSTLHDVLSPIYEESEENTTFNSNSSSPSPITSRVKSRYTSRPPTSTVSSNPRTPLSFSSNTVVLHSPVSTRIQRSPSHIVSPNHFARNSANPNLLEALLSVQSDMTANSSSQRFLLSSLITNLYQDIERKDLKIENLECRTHQMESDWNAAIEEAGNYERYHTFNSPTRVRNDQAKIQALEDLMEQLRVELETRTKSDRFNIQQVSQETNLLRSELQRNNANFRDAEIRLRHVQASQVEAEESRRRSEEEKLVLEERVLELQLLSESSMKEKEQLITTLQRERREYQILMENIRISLERSPAEDSTHSLAGRSKAEWNALEMELVATKSEVENLQHYNKSNVEIIEQQRLDSRSICEELAKSQEEVRTISIVLETSKLDAIAIMDHLKDEISMATKVQNCSDQEIGIIEARCNSLEVETDRLLEEVRSKDEALHSLNLVWKESLESNARLAESFAQKESDSMQTISDLEEVRKDLVVLLDDRDNRLVVTQKNLAKQTAAAGSSKQELSRAKELVSLLRRESADREVRIVRLKKTRAELLEDKSGLEIALDAKQHEVTMWKRQVATARLPYVQDTTQIRPTSRTALSTIIPQTMSEVSSTTTTIPRISSSQSDTPTIKNTTRGRQSPILNLPSTPSHLPIASRSNFGSASKVRDVNRAALKENGEPSRKKMASVRF